MMARLPAARRRILPAALAVAALASGCATPPDHFHTLRPAAMAVTPAMATGVPHLLSVGPVTVPDALGRDEWLIRTGDTGAMVYDHQLWTQDLGAEVAQALVDYLNRGPLPDALWADAGPTGTGSGADLEVAPTLRLRVQVLRLDSLLAPVPAVDDELRWTIECLPSDPTLSPVDAGRYRVLRTAVRDVGGPAPAANPAVDEDQQRYDRVARAHSEALRGVAADIAGALRDSAAERMRVCVPGAR